MDPTTLEIMESTEEILLEGAPTHKFYHNGGAIKFGNDGKLYVTTGDGGGDGVATSQDLTNLHGVIMRLNDDGTVPDDNPFTAANGYDGVPCGQNMGMVPSGSPATAVCSEIFSYGLRNPFRLVMDPFTTNTTRFRIHDVGGAVWEDISEGGTGFAGMNYGW
jgi:glucose/arabinose dehydrogenase